MTSSVPEGTEPIILPELGAAATTASSTPISWTVKIGSAVREGDVVGYYYCYGDDNDGVNGNGAVGSSGREGAAASSGQIRPRKRSRPVRPGVGGGGAAGGKKTAAPAGAAAASKKKAAGVSLGSLMAGMSRTDSTLTGAGGRGSSNDGRAPSSSGADKDENGGGDADVAENSKSNGASAATEGEGKGKGGAAASNNRIALRAPSDGFLRILASSGNGNHGNDRGEKATDGSAVTVGRGVVVVGYVEPCHHPAVIGGLCAVCGSTVDHTGKGHSDTATGAAVPSAVAPAVSASALGPKQSGKRGDGSGSSMTMVDASPSSSSATLSGSSINPKKRGAKTSHLTVSGGLTVSISQSEAESIASDSSARLRSARKLSLVLDLDHTLLHATADPRANAYVAARSGLRRMNDDDDDDEDLRRVDVRTLVLPMTEGGPPPGTSSARVGNNPQRSGQMMMPAPLRHYVKLRPHLAKFLTEASQRYELTIYTAGTRAYAHKVAHVVSRHIVGARLDEEELNNLRRSLAVAEESARRYEVKMKRRRYVEGLNQKFNGSTNAAEAEEEEEETQVQEDASTSEIIVGEIEEASASAVSTVEEKKGDDEETDKPKGQAATRKSGDAMSGAIPRKRRRVSFDPAAKEEKKPSKSNDNDAAEATVDTKGAEEKKVEEEEHDREELEATVKRLRDDLCDAERLEKKATELRMKLFGSRIVSRTDVSDLGRDVKSLRRVFPCGGTMAAIIDDREDVWANAENNATGRPGEPPDNLLLVRPYHWKPFSGFADVNNEAGVDMTKAGGDKDNKAESLEDEEQQETQLLWMGDILRRVHERYYAQTIDEDERDKLSVPGILSDLRRNVLGSFPRCKIVLSGLVPLHKQNQIAAGAAVRRPRPPIVRYTESLGAKVIPDVTNDTTHVIAARDGTEKTMKARRVPGCAVVRISWLMECYWSITRRELSPKHLIGPPPKPVPAASSASAGESSKQDGASGNKNTLLLSGSDSSEDEDLAAEMAMELELMQS